MLPRQLTVLPCILFKSPDNLTTDLIFRTEGEEAQLISCDWMSRLFDKLTACQPDNDIAQQYKGSCGPWTHSTLRIRSLNLIKIRVQFREGHLKSWLSTTVSLLI